MNDVDGLLNQLGKAARREPSPSVDVRERVLQSVSIAPVKVDWFPVVCGGIACVVAATLLVACLPCWQTMFDPWASFFVQ